MNRIFVEAQKMATSECNFLKALLTKYLPGKQYEFVCMGGVGNLFNETNVNQMRQAVDVDDNVVVLLDADTAEKGWGYAARKDDINSKMVEHQINVPLFLYPNNNDDGDVETLMEGIARKDLHRDWWNCFEDYEKCVGGVRNEKGEKRYVLPNRKAKLHTYISSQNSLNRKVRDKLGSGDWLFGDSNYWDLSNPLLEPLVAFFKANLK